MTDHHRANPPSAGPPPTPKQQALLRRLALERGVTFTPPRTRAQASREIERLLKQRKDTRGDARRDVRAVQDDIASGRGDAVRVRYSETSGYGASAMWKRGA